MRNEPQRCVLVLPGEVPMAFRRITPGECALFPRSFRMGERGFNAAEEPIHEVVLNEPFWMAETPVTQAQFAAWTSREGIQHENHFPNRPDHPAENLDWHQAVAYSGWLCATVAEQLPDPGLVATLPTEVQWEYACRAGTETEFYTGDGEAALAVAGWFGVRWDSGATPPVGRKAPNAFGLFDMHGNVWEWCADVFDARAYRKRSVIWAGRGWGLEDAGTDAEYANDQARGRKDPWRVVRGGSWVNSADWCRSAFRYEWGPVARAGNFGFRLCLVRGHSEICGASASSATEAEPGPGNGGRGTRPESKGLSTPEQWNSGDGGNG